MKHIAFCDRLSAVGGLQDSCYHAKHALQAVRCAMLRINTQSFECHLINDLMHGFSRAMHRKQLHGRLCSSSPLYKINKSGSWIATHVKGGGGHFVGHWFPSALKGLSGRIYPT